MDPSQKFAQAVLDQLRRDLKRFAGRFRTGRSGDRRYLREVEAANLQVSDAFRFMRLVGFTPAEYLSRLDRASRGIPRSVPGFLARYPLKAPRGFSYIVDFVHHVREIPISKEGPLYELLELDLGKRLDSLAGHRELGPEEILKYAQGTMPIIESNPALPLGSLPDLIRSVLLIAKSVSAVEPRSESLAAHLIDVGFQFETFVDDIPLRYELYGSASEVSARLGSSLDAIWCLAEAARLALLSADNEKLQRAVQRRRQLTRFLPDDDPEDARLLDLMALDRRQTQLTGEQLDSMMGGRRAFRNVLARRRPLSLANWRKMDAVLCPSVSSLERAAAADLSFPGSKGLFFALKLDRRHQRAHESQGHVLTWARHVEVKADAPGLELPECLLQVERVVPVDADGILTYLAETASEGRATLSIEDAKTLIRGFIYVGYHFKNHGKLDDAAECTEMAFCLLDQISDPQVAAFAYRVSADLLVHLGDLKTAEIFARRSTRLEIFTGGGASELVFSLYAEFVVSYLYRRFQEAERLLQACKTFITKRQAKFPSTVVDLALASTYLRLRRPDLAERILDELDSAFPDGPDRSEFLLVKAECMSCLGHVQGPELLLDEARALLIPDHHSSEIMVIELERCKHLLRSGSPDRAAKAARSLLGQGLPLHPIAAGIVQDLVVSMYQADRLTIQVLAATQQGLKYPRLKQRVSR